jgi:hypothetical protein
VKKTAKALPKSPRKKQAVISKLLKQFGAKNIIEPPSTMRMLSQETRTKVQEFYDSDEISRTDPGKKTARVSRNGDRTAEPVTARRYLLFTIIEAHGMFQEMHSEVKISRSKFAALRPPYVRPYKDIPHNVCVCR